MEHILYLALCGVPGSLLNKIHLPCVEEVADELGWEGKSIYGNNAIKLRHLHNGGLRAVAARGRT